jgi:hypothetical protein
MHAQVKSFPYGKVIQLLKLPGAFSRKQSLDPWRSVAAGLRKPKFLNRDFRGTTWVLMPVLDSAILVIMEIFRVLVDVRGTSSAAEIMMQGIWHLSAAATLAPGKPEEWQRQTSNVKT